MNQDLTKYTKKYTFNKVPRFWYSSPH